MTLLKFDLQIYKSSYYFFNKDETTLFIEIDLLPDAANLMMISNKEILLEMVFEPDTKLITKILLNLVQNSEKRVLFVASISFFNYLRKELDLNINEMNGLFLDQDFIYEIFLNNYIFCFKYKSDERNELFEEKLLNFKLLNEKRV